MKTQKKVHKKLLKSVNGFIPDAVIKETNKIAMVREYFLGISMFLI